MTRVLAPQPTRSRVAPQYTGLAAIFDTPSLIESDSQFIAPHFPSMAIKPSFVK